MSNKRKLIPTLRFPEFKEDGEWEEKKLGEIGDIVTGKTPNTKDKNLWAGEILFITPTDIDNNGKYQTTTLRKVVENPGVKELPIGTIVYTCIASIGKIAITTKRSISNQQINSIVPFEKYYNEFLYYSLVNITPLIKSMPATSTLPIINKTDFSLFTIRIPQKYPEQQKIADCLSSLDDLLAAHNEKLKLLKAHKKGLMQNLFPQEGETVPKVRFPEFEEDGEWELKPFSKFIKLYRGSSPRPIREYLTKEETGVNWIKIGDTSSITDFVIRSVSEKITPKGAEKSRRVKKGELILANSMSYGSTYLLEVEGCIYDGWFVLREYEEYFDKQFLLQLLNSEYTQGQYKRFAAGGIVQNISSEIVYSITLSKTSKEEQQKIASCLSAVDELIIAQQEKIDELQQHKKGLMQGLFPKMEN